jgi:Ca-activated chloride channel family protein
MDAAKEYAAGFIEALDSHTRVGIVSFSGITFIESTLTTDRGELMDTLERIEVQASGTDIPGAIITSTNVLTASERGRAIILLTDGSNTIETFTSRSVQRATQYAALNHVKIYAIGIGTPDQAPLGYLPTYYNVSAAYNPDNLRAIANATGGKHYEARNGEELQAAYEDIRAADKVSTIKTDLTPGLMLIALLLLMLEWGLINTHFRSIP